MPGRAAAVLSIYFLFIYLSICINYPGISQFTKSGKAVKALITQMVRAEPFALSHSVNSGMFGGTAECVVKALVLALTYKLTPLPA